MIRVWATLVLCFGLAACGETPVAETAPGTGDGPAVLVMGDSMMAFNRFSGRSVADWIEAGLGAPVTDRSASGASVLRTEETQNSRGKIPNQLLEGEWDWIVLNGFGNDLLFGCGCGACTGQLARLISPDGTDGAIPDMVADLRNTSAQVIYLGYLRTPGFAAPTEGCADLGFEMDDRLAAMAARDAGVTYLSLSDLVPEGDTSFHTLDRIHPSPKGSRAISGEVLEVILAD